MGLSGGAVPHLHAGEVQTDAALVGRLLAAQFPQWSGLPVRPVAASGTDNAMYRLGDAMVARLPRIERAASQVWKETFWLPRLAPELPLAIPTPLALGGPGAGYPWPWSIYGWIEGEPASPEHLSDPSGIALRLAGFIKALHRIDPSDGPPPGPHNVYRGQPLGQRYGVIRAAIAQLDGEIDAQAATAVWDEALAAAPWPGPPVWVHGDLMPRNLLIEGRHLAAVIDFGCLGVGDPACDLTPAWNLFRGDARRVFREALGLDEDTWKRACGWALCVVSGIRYYRDSDPAFAAHARRIVDAVLADPDA